MVKSKVYTPKEICDALEFVSKQVCVPFGNTKSIKPKPIKTKSKSKDEYTYPPGLDELFIEQFGKEQFDKCPTLMDKIEFIREHWDELK